MSDAALEVSFTCEDPGVIFQMRSDEMVVDNTAHRSRSFLNANDSNSSSVNSIIRLRSVTTDRLPDVSLSRVHSRTNSENSIVYPSLSSIGSDNFTFSNMGQNADEIDQIGRSLHRDHMTVDDVSQIEEVLMRAGRERRIEVGYTPCKDLQSSDYRGGRLVKRTFRINISYRQSRSQAVWERKTIQCIARTCTSFIEVTPIVINFGDTDGDLKNNFSWNIQNRIYHGQKLLTVAG